MRYGYFVAVTLGLGFDVVFLLYLLKVEIFLVFDYSHHNHVAIQ